MQSQDEICPAASAIGMIGDEQSSGETSSQGSGLEVVQGGTQDAGQREGSGQATTSTPSEHSLPSFLGYPSGSLSRNVSIPQGELQEVPQNHVFLLPTNCQGPIPAVLPEGSFSEFHGCDSILRAQAELLDAVSGASWDQLCAEDSEGYGLSTIAFQDEQNLNSNSGSYSLGALAFDFPGNFPT